MLREQAARLVEKGMVAKRLPQAFDRRHGVAARLVDRGRPQLLGGLSLCEARRLLRHGAVKP
jgi:hypothetical protein